MLYKFKSQAAAEVIMLRDTGDELLKIIGKTPGATGIITVAQIPAAIAALQAEVKRREALPEPQAEEDKKDHAKAGDEPIALGRRVVPFIDLLRESAEAGKDVVWGV